MKIQLFKILLVLLIICGSAYAQDGLAMMKISHGARQSGMASAVVSILDNPDNTAYNPALAVAVEKFTASFGHTSYWENIRQESFYFAKKSSNRIYLHGGIRFAAIDNLEYRSVVPSEEPISEFDAHDLSFKSGISIKASERLSFGLAMGWFIEKIEAWRGSAFNVDLGVHYIANDKLQIGASALNLGSDFNLSKPGNVGSNDIALPKAYRLGASYKHQKYLGALDVVITDDKTHLHLGAEGDVHKMFKIRSGYMFNYDSKNFTAGFSFVKRNITVDYAFVPFSNELGTAHMFNFSFSL